MPTTPTRAWKGASAEDRRAERRERFVAAALEVIGTVGWQKTTVKGICSEAGLTERYFYEAFPDRDALLVTAFEAVRDETLAAVQAALMSSAGSELRDLARAAIDAGLRVLTDDPRKGRILFLEAPMSELLRERSQDELLNVAKWLMLAAAESFGGLAIEDQDAELNAIAIVAAESALATAYLSGRLNISRDRLVDHITELHLAAVRVSSQ